MIAKCSQWIYGMPLGGISVRTVWFQRTITWQGKHWPKRRLERHKWPMNVRATEDCWRARGTIVNVQFTRANVNDQLVRFFDAETGGDRAHALASRKSTRLWKTSGTVIFYKWPTALTAVWRSTASTSTLFGITWKLDTELWTSPNYLTLGPVSFGGKCTVHFGRNNAADSIKLRATWTVEIVRPNWTLKEVRGAFIVLRPGCVFRMFHDNSNACKHALGGFSSAASMYCF